MTEIGPLQILAFDFRRRADFARRILNELGTLELSGTIRLLDVLFARKDRETGDLIALDDSEQGLGTICGALLGFGFDDGEQSVPPAPAVGPSFGFGTEQIEALGAELHRGHSAGFVLLEHVWAKRFKVAVARAGGVSLGEGLLSREAFAPVAAEIESRVRALDEIGGEVAPGGWSVDDGLLAARAGRRVRPAAAMNRRRSYASRPDDYTRELERLAKLRDDGVITAADFDRKKQQVLGI